MTRKEAERQSHQAGQLTALGFTPDEAESLRRISMTLHRWHELECGTDSACLVRGRWDNDKGEFVYDDHGLPYFELAGGSGRSRYQRIYQDRERGAMRRLETIIKARNDREKDARCSVFGCGSQAKHDHRDRNGIVGFSFDPADHQPVRSYIQTDPRGATLYIIRPGDVTDGGDVHSYYSRGVCVF